MNKAQIAQLENIRQPNRAIRGKRTTMSGTVGKRALDTPKEEQSAGVPAEARKLSTLLGHWKKIGHQLKFKSMVIGLNEKPFITNQ